MNSALSPRNSSRHRPRRTTPSYPAKRISTVHALSMALEYPEKQLVEIARSSDQYFRLHDRIEKPDGTTRELFDLNPPLKVIQQRINAHFLKRCRYPEYLTGSLPRSSYIKNAVRHAGQGTVLTIDATNFFPSISDELVFRIWNQLFKFGEAPSQVLTQLCTRSGFLAQGAPVSSYLANLAFWDIEPHIFRELESRGFQYTRYVDDIIVSRRRKLSSQEKSWAIRTAQKVFLSKGLQIKTRKTKVMDRNKQQIANNLIVNSGRPSGGKDKKGRLRAELNQLRQDIQNQTSSIETLQKSYTSLRGKLLHYRSTNPEPAKKLIAELDSLKF